MSSISRPCLGTIPQNDLQGSLLKPLGVLWNQINCWYQRYRERQELSQLDPRLREDLGLSDAAIDREIKKPFWLH